MLCRKQRALKQGSAPKELTVSLEGLVLNSANIGELGQGKYGSGRGTVAMARNARIPSCL